MKRKDFEEDIVFEVCSDFKKRREARKAFEAKWKLNNNFFIGNQYSGINMSNDVENYDKQYYWQEREVFNHIAPIVEARISKLSAVRPKMKVFPASGSDDDVKVAKLSKDILSYCYDKLNINRVILDATVWSEITGTSFYKVSWNQDAGNPIWLNEQTSKVYREGDVLVEALSPYEIFPDSQSAGDIDKCESIIHARAYSVKEIKNIWGVDVDGEDTLTFDLGTVQNVGGLGYKSVSHEIEGSLKKDHAIVIERYEMPCEKYPEGRLVIVCGNKLLFCGDLPYVNFDEVKRGFPFVRQVCVETPGCFWGTSVIERLIPIQRAYNAVKNRKHEYLNRLSMGVLTVEDGSVDVENLQEEGLSPGKVLIYRQGSNPPKIMDKDSMPNEFSEEEEKLLAEFSEIGGVSNILTSSSWSRSLSGRALELLVEQDTARLNITADNIKMAVKMIAKQILKLYKQFAVSKRLVKITNSNSEVETVYWDKTDLSSAEVEIEAEAESGENSTVKQEQILKLLNAGLLNDEDGKISQSLRVKILEMFGLGVWDGNVDETLLQKNYADQENIKLISNPTEVEVLEIDNHDIHISRHVSFMLDRAYQKAYQENKEVRNVFLEHIRKHKTEQLKKESKKVDANDKSQK